MHMGFPKSVTKGVTANAQKERSFITAWLAECLPASGGRFCGGGLRSAITGCRTRFGTRSGLADTPSTPTVRTGTGTGGWRVAMRL
jgi:hypothetical protein